MTSEAKPLIDKCRDALDAYFTQYPNPNLQASCMGALFKFLKDNPELNGNLNGWMGGLVYAVDNDGIISPCGVRGMLNADFEKAWGVTMGTIRKRSWAIRMVLKWTDILSSNR